MGENGGKTVPQLEFGEFGEFDEFDAQPATNLERREALWMAGAVAYAQADRLPGVVVGATPPELPPMTVTERTVADLWATGLSADHHPVEFARAALDAQGVLTAAALLAAEPGTRVRVAGVVTHRQRPATAGGTTFLNLEDETGLINVVCSKVVWARYRRAARGAGALLIRGMLERSEGVVNVVAERIEVLPVLAHPASRDFR